MLFNQVSVSLISVIYFWSHLSLMLLTQMNIKPLALKQDNSRDSTKILLQLYDVIVPRLKFHYMIIQFHYCKIIYQIQKFPLDCRDILSYRLSSSSVNNSYYIWAVCCGNFGQTWCNRPQVGYAYATDCFLLHQDLLQQCE